MRLIDSIRRSSIDRIRKQERKNRDMLNTTISNIGEEIRAAGYSHVTVKAPNMIQMPLAMIDINNLDPDYYNPDSQASLVLDYLKDIESVSDFDRRIDSMVHSSGVKCSKGFLRLNSITMEVLGRYA